MTVRREQTTLWLLSSEVVPHQEVHIPRERIEREWERERERENLHSNYERENPYRSSVVFSNTSRLEAHFQLFNSSSWLNRESLTMHKLHLWKIKVVVSLPNGNLQSKHKTLKVGQTATTRLLYKVKETGRNSTNSKTDLVIWFLYPQDWCHNTAVQLYTGKQEETHRNRQRTGCLMSK